MTVRLARCSNVECGYLYQTPGGHRVPCGRCMACRINRRRFWEGRILFEDVMSPHPSYFVTLTYADEQLPVLPESPTQTTLSPTDFRLWANRFRKYNGPFRYYGCGEYGDKTQRPHYHAVIFNHPAADVEAMVEKSWTKGFTTTSELNPSRARYVAKYAVKRLNKNDLTLNGRYPEFARMSRKPPLANTMMTLLQEQLTTRAGAQFLAEKKGLPTVLRHNNKLYPIGRYWRKKMEEELDYAFPPYEDEREEIEIDVAALLARRKAARAERQWKKRVADKESTL